MTDYSYEEMALRKARGMVADPGVNMKPETAVEGYLQMRLHNLMTLVLLTDDTINPDNRKLLETNAALYDSAFQNHQALMDVMKNREVKQS